MASDRTQVSLKGSQVASARDISMVKAILPGIRRVAKG